MADTISGVKPYPNSRLAMERIVNSAQQSMYRGNPAYFKCVQHHRNA
ncbi:MAG: hypothetical protein Q4E43_07435 [Akkermansia sp.]|nr:hypothetical protein [Akkermansia sp.]